MNKSGGSPAILKEGETCWRVATARRAAVLIDGAAYYGALRAALSKAERSVFVAGWDIDSRTPLIGPSGAAEDGLPEELGPFLTRLVERRPALAVHLLLWDYSMLYALEREPLPSINLDWATPPQITVCLDDVVPIGASHHQKIVVIDDALAFCGGLDLTVRRWDTPAHDVHDARRVDPRGEPYRPFHDMQMMVDGGAAMALAELVRRRWEDAACEIPIRPEARGDPWPDGVEADFRDVAVGIARTLPTYNGRPEVREVEALHLRSIEAAERTIYIENQFLTAGRLAERLAGRMRENPDLEVLIVAPSVHHSWLEEQSMTAGRRRFMKRLEEAGVQDRVRLLYPALPDDPSGEGTMVHAKAMIVDDRLLRVGSANLCNRSMGTDTECDLALEGRTPEARGTIAAIRNRLLAEHLGAGTKAVERAIGEKGSLLGAVAELSGGPRDLKPIDLGAAPDDELARTVGRLTDPERPIASPLALGDAFGGQAVTRPSSRLLRLTAAAGAVVALAAAWRYTPLSDLVNPQTLMHWLEQLRTVLWMPLVMPVVYLLGGLIVFPVTVLIAVTGMMFGPLPAFAYALGGSLLSAALTYLIGHAAGRGPLRRLVGRRVNRVSRALARQGVLSVAAIRMVPIAPFTVVNLVAGASHIGFVDYMLGTLAGMIPGIFVLIFLGHQLASVLSDPDPAEMLLLGLCVAGWLALSVALQLLASRLRRRRDD